MKKQSLFRMSFLILCLWVFSGQAQTLVNQTATDKGGILDHQYTYFKALPLPAAYGGGQLFVQDNYSIANGSSEVVSTTDSTNTLINSVDLAPLNGSGSVATTISLRKNYVYVGGVTLNTAGTNSSSYHLILLDVNTLDTLWMVSSPDSSQYPVALISDDSSYIYAAMSKRSGTDEKIAICKYDRNGNKLYESDYDSTGFYNIPVGMVLSGNYVIITGFNFNSGASNFITYEMSRNTGINDAPKYSSNGTGVISRPVNLYVDSQGITYVAGTSGVSGSASVMKLVTYYGVDSSFHQRSVTTYGDSTKTNTLAAFCIDGQNNQAQNILLAGTTIDGSGHHSIAVLKYDISGALKWSKTIAATNPVYPTNATDITYDVTGNIYVTGTQFNGSDTDILTFALDSSSNVLWQQRYGRSFGTNEAPYNIGMNSDGSISVTGRSFGTDSQYVLLNLTQDKTNNAPDSTKPSQQWAYYENLGQVIDTGTNQASYVHYYTNTANPRLYITDYALSYVFSSMDSLADTLQRVDMTLEKSEIGSDPTTPTYYGTEQIKPYFNYYIGGLPQYYEDVHGYQRVTVKGIYPNIDCQLYSDSGGLKYYYVVNPGGSPTDIQFKYTGADSITHDSTGMKIYSRYGVASQLPFTAWQYSSGSATQVSLGLSVVSSTEFTFTTGSYNSSLPLYIRMAQQAQATAAVDSIENLKWSTYLGGSGGDGATDIDIDNHHQQYVTGYTQSTDFPTTIGIAFVNSAGHLGSFLTKFDSSNIILYSVFYGGSNRDSGTTLNIQHNTNAVAAGIFNTFDSQFQPVYIAGQTPYTDLPIPSNPMFPSGLHNGTYAGGESDGFVVLLNGFNGQLKQASYIGSDREDGINTLEIDMDTTRNPNTLYLGGYTTGTNFPFQNTFSGNFYDDQGRGVLMQLDESMNTKWTTGFGSHSLYFNNGTDSVGCTINDIKLDHAGNILIVGNSYFTFPTASPYNISRPNTNSFWVSSHPNTSTPPTTAFLAKLTPFNGGTDNKYKLYYFSEYGDNEFDNGQKICANSTNDIYIAGQGFRNNLTQDTSFDYITTGQGSDGAYIVRFSPDGVLLANGDYGGCLNITFGDMFCDVEDNVFVFGGTGVNNTLFSALQKTNWYWDTYTANKCFLAEVNPSNVMTWSTLFGGRVNERQGGMCIDGNNMYITGKTSTNDAQNSGFLAFPLVSNSVATFFPNYGGDGTIGGDAFIARFSLGNLTPLTSISDVKNPHSAINCYPNPSNGKFMVSFTDFDNGDKVVTLYDYMGQSLYSAHTTNNSMEINGAEKFATGVYIIEVCSSNKKEVSKIVISHQ